MVIYLFLVRPAKNQSELGLLILTLGLALFLGGLDALVFGTDNKVIPPLVQHRLISVGGASFSIVTVVTALVGVVLMIALWLVIRFTRLGLALRAVAEREDVAQALGIPVRTVLTATWAAAAMLACAAALLFAPSALLHPAMILDPLSKGFIAAVIGGMHSPLRAVLVHYIFVVLQLVFAISVLLQFMAAFAFLPVILVLILRPHGILGKLEIKRV